MCLYTDYSRLEEKFSRLHLRGSDGAKNVLSFPSDLVKRLGEHIVGRSLHVWYVSDSGIFGNYRDDSSIQTGFFLFWNMSNLGVSGSFPCLLRVCLHWLKKIQIFLVAFVACYSLFLGGPRVNWEIHTKTSSPFLSGKKICVGGKSICLQLSQFAWHLLVL